MLFGLARPWRISDILISDFDFWCISRFTYLLIYLLSFHYVGFLVRRIGGGGSSELDPPLYWGGLSANGCHGSPIDPSTNRARRRVTSLIRPTMLRPYATPPPSKPNLSHFRVAVADALYSALGEEHHGGAISWVLIWKSHDNHRIKKAVLF